MNEFLLKRYNLKQRNLNSTKILIICITMLKHIKTRTILLINRKSINKNIYIFYKKVIFKKILTVLCKSSKTKK